MVLARLLTPADMGLYAVTMALLAFAATVRDLGAGQYLLQEKDLTVGRIRAVWAIQLSVGVILGAAVAAFSMPMSAFFGDARMRDILLVLALNYIVNPFGSVTYAWLMREMRYDAVAVTRFTATCTGAAVSIWLAWRGLGALSLAWGSVCSTVANALVSTFFRPARYPWLPSFRDARRVLSFGTQVTSSSIINTMAAGAPEFLVGKLQGLAAAGLYSRANGLVAMFSRLVTDAVYSVALSLFARESRQGQGSASSFLKAISYTTALSASFSIALIFLAHPIIRLLYGPQWDGSVGATRVLACVAVGTAVIPVCSAALLGAGEVKKALTSTVASACISVFLVVAGAWHGIEILAAAVAVATALSSVIWFRAVRAVLQFDWKPLLAILVRSGAVAGTAGMGPVLAYTLFGAQPQGVLAPVLVGASGGAAGLLLGVVLFRHPLGAEFARYIPLLRRFCAPHS